MHNNYLVIMAGGVGSRFWPMSTAQKPKQFLDILNVGQTMLQQTLERFKHCCPVSNVFLGTLKVRVSLQVKPSLVKNAHRNLIDTKKSPLGVWGKTGEALTHTAAS